MLLLRKDFNVDCLVGCMVDSLRRHYCIRIPVHQKHLRMAQQPKLLSDHHVRLSLASTLNNLHQAGMHRRGGFLDMENQIFPESTRFITQASPDLEIKFELTAWIIVSLNLFIVIISFDIQHASSAPPSRLPVVRRAFTWLHNPTHVSPQFLPLVNVFLRR